MNSEALPYFSYFSRDLSCGTQIFSRGVDHEKNMSSLLARRLLTLHKLEPGLIDFYVFFIGCIWIQEETPLGELADERDDISLGEAIDEEMFFGYIV